MTEPHAASFEYAMPSLGADMDEGRVIEWRIQPGDTVHRGDLIATVETEKSDIDIEIWHDGIIEAFLVDVGQLVDVGTPIARLRTVDDAAPPSAGPAREPTPDPNPEPTPHPKNAVGVAPSAAPAPHFGAVHAPATATGGRVPASPLARRLAAQHGLDIEVLRGSGPGGAVIESDVIAASTAAATVATTTPSTVASPAPPVDTPAPAEPPPTSSWQRSQETMRSVIAERMSTANREIPHYHLSRELDVGPLESWLAERNAERPIAERVLAAACFLRAVALAAARHRELNGFWVDDHLEPADSVNVATAISLRRGGLVTPQIERADERSLDEMMAALTELVAAARSGRLKASWMTGASITVTHLGDTGADLVHGVISPPQVALVGFGRSRLRPWVIDDAVVARPVVTCTLAADHRATDGATGSRFLATLADLIDQPEDLL